MASILGAKYADELFGMFPAADISHKRKEKKEEAFRAVRLMCKGRFSRVHLTARRAWRWVWMGKYIRNNPRWPITEKVLTGGALIEATVSTTLFLSPTKTIRLKPGWDEKAFKCAVQKLLDWALRETNRQVMAEQVQRVAETIRGTEEFSDAVTAEEERYGKNSDFSSMTVEDAEHWLQWLSEYKKGTTNAKVHSCSD